MTGPISSPCRMICRLGHDQRCDGCGRTTAEIAAWSRLGEPARLAIMARLGDWVPREPAPGPASPLPPAGRDR